MSQEKKKQGGINTTGVIFWLPHAYAHTYMQTGTHICAYIHKNMYMYPKSICITATTYEYRYLLYLKMDTKYGKGETYFDIYF